MVCKKKIKPCEEQEKTTNLLEVADQSCSESGVCEKNNKLGKKQSMVLSQPNHKKQSNYKEFIRFLLAGDIDDESELADEFD